MKSLSCQHHREAFLKSFTIASRTKPIRRSDSPREVCLSFSARATLAFKLNGGFTSFARSAAARSEAEETVSKRPKSLLNDFNGTDAAVLKAAAAVPAIAGSGERAPLKNAEIAAAFIAEFIQNAGKTRALHESNPGAGDRNSRLTIETTYPAHLTRPEISLPREVLNSIAVVLRGMGVRGAVCIGNGKFSEVFSLRDADGNRTGSAVKISTKTSNLDSIKTGQAGTEAYALLVGEMLAASGGGPSPFMPQRMLSLGCTLLAVPLQRGAYASVLFLGEASRTATPDVQRLARAIHAGTGLFVPLALDETRQFLKSLLSSLNQLHRMGIAHRDVKPANILVKDSEAAVPEIVLSDAGMAVFPTSQHRPFYSSPGSSPVTPQMLRLGSARATAVLNRATGGTEVRLSLPPNIDPLIPIHIQQDELKTIFTSSFRVRDNAGTHVYTGPEFPFNRSKGTMMSTEFLPGDMWAVGWIVLQILSGCKVEWIQDADLKRKMANCSLSQFWSDYLHLPGVPSEDPAALCAIDFVRGLLLADPAQRLSCSAALAHPFLNQV